MKQLPWPRFGSDSMELAVILVPETDQDRQILLDALDDAGVRNSLAFNKAGINGRIDFHHDHGWDKDGGFEVAISMHDQPKIAAWFWIIELDDGRRFAWWALKNDSQEAIAWT